MPLVTLKSVTDEFRRKGCAIGSFSLNGIRKLAGDNRTGKTVLHKTDLSGSAGMAHNEI